MSKIREQLSVRQGDRKVIEDTLRSAEENFNKAKASLWTAQQTLADMDSEILKLSQSLERLGELRVSVTGDNGDKLGARRLAILPWAAIENNLTTTSLPAMSRSDGLAIFSDVTPGRYGLMRLDLPNGFTVLGQNDRGYLVVDVIAGRTTSVTLQAVSSPPPVAPPVVVVSPPPPVAPPVVVVSPPPPVPSSLIDITPDKFDRLEDNKKYRVVGDHTIDRQYKIKAKNITIDFTGQITTTVTDTMVFFGEGSIISGGTFKSLRGHPFVLCGQGSQLLNARLAPGSGGLVMVRAKGARVMGNLTLGRYADYFIYVDGENSDVTDHIVSGNIDTFGSDNQSSLRIMGGGGIVRGNKLTGKYKSSAMRCHHTQNERHAYIIQGNLLSNTDLSGCALMVGKMTGGDGGEQFGMIQESDGTWRPQRQDENEPRFGWDYNTAIQRRRYWISQRFGGAKISGNDITGLIRLGPTLPGDGRFDIFDNIQRMPTKGHDCFNIMLRAENYPTTTLPGDYPSKYASPQGTLTNHKIIVADPATKFGWMPTITRKNVTMQTGESGKAVVVS